jgi:hypothetical protein
MANTKLAMSNAEKLEAFNKLQAKNAWYTAKWSHDQGEMKRLINEHGLKGEMQPFEKTVEDFMD